MTKRNIRIKSASRNIGNSKRREHYKSIRKMKGKLTVLFTLIMLILLAVIIRIAYITETNGDKYTKKVLAQQSTNNLVLPYKRGDILDRNGVVLATSEKVFNLIFDPKVLLQNASDEKEKDCVEPTINALSKYFDLDENELHTILKEKSDSSYVPLLKKLTKDEIRDFENFVEGTEEGSKIKGVWFENDYIRKYPNTSLACKVIGYTVAGNQGQTGIEEEYSEVLNGTNGRSYNYLNEDLESEKNVVEPVNGYNVVTTIDSNLQRIAETYIQKFIDDYTNKSVTGPAAKNIGVILMDPSNGEILAMATDTKFDLNNPHDLVLNGYITEEQEAGMSEEELLELRNAMWRNFCISDGYEPGSTVKPMTVAAALEEGVVSDSSTFLCDGRQVVAGRTIRCAKRSGHGIISLNGSIMFSCNDALMQIAAMQGYDSFYKYQQIFNFGLKTNIDLPGETNNAYSVYTAETTGPTELATNSFGQGFNTTMIQVASAFSSVINGGYYYKPHVAKTITNEDGGVVENIDKVLVKQTISSKTSKQLKQYLYNTMYGEVDGNGNSATGKKARVAGYAMGGKTGTAQKLPRSAGKYLVSFIGFAPVDNPKLVCYVVVDEPNAANASAQASSAFAQEIFKNIMSEAMPYLNIFPTEEIPEDMLDEVKTEEIENISVEEQENNEEVIPEGMMKDPNTGELIQMPTEEDNEEEFSILDFDSELLIPLDEEP